MEHIVTKQALTALAVLCCAAPVLAARKYLILHSMPHVLARPGYVQAAHDYLDTLPFDGLAVYVDDFSTNVTGTAMQPVAISLATIQNVLAPMNGLTWTNFKKHFGLLYYGPGWADAYDDAKWAIVAQNMANYAKAVRDQGFAGIIFDNENYGAYGNYGDATCGSPHTLDECQAQMRARGNQVMQAMMAQFPSIVVIFMRDTYISDTVFYNQPQFTVGHNDFANDISASNRLVGPFQVGFVQAAQGTAAKTVGGAEDPGFGAKTPQDFKDIYNYQKFGQVDDSLPGTDTVSHTAGPNGYIPQALRAVWQSAYSAGVAVYDISNMDPANNMPTTLAATITNALNQVDEYAWLYMEVWSSVANPPHPSLLIPPGSDPEAAPQAFIDAVRQGWLAGRGTADACDVNGDGKTNVLDVQIAVNQAIKLLPCTADINQDQACNVVDVQRIVNEAIGGACLTGP